MLKKMIFIVIAWIIFCGSTAFAADKVIPLPDVMTPGWLEVNDQYVYISDKGSICIYSAKDFKLLKRIGKEGQGPQEFAVSPNQPVILALLPNQLIATSIGKISRFTLDGTFIDEKRIPQATAFFLPIGDNFVGMKFGVENKILYKFLTILSPEIQPIKNIGQAELEVQGPGQGSKWLYTAFWHQVLGNQIFTATDKDFIINVFDKDGNQSYSIKQDYQLVAFSDEDKKRMTKFFETNPATRDIMQYLKPLQFPDTFPAILAFYARDNSLYVFTWKKDKANNKEVIILDPRGKLLKKTFLPLQVLDEIKPVPFIVNKGKFYQVVENEETEMYELQICDIK